MAELPLLVNIAVALGYALAGGLLARRLGLPTIVGYLVAGVALGPLTPGFRGDPAAIHQMAEFGVILLMFGVGLHFSFRDLWQVRRIVIPGAIIQMLVVSAIGYWLARQWGFSAGGAWVFGIATSVASTVVQMRSLMDHGWLDTPHGKVAIGWLVVEDLLVVAILVLLPVVAGPSTTGPWATAAIAVGKAVLFVALMMFAGARVVPFILGRVVHTRSRELFVLVATGSHLFQHAIRMPHRNRRSLLARVLLLLVAWLSSPRLRRGSSSGVRSRSIERWGLAGTRRSTNPAWHTK